MKDIPEFEDLYSVTRDGRVWSKRRNHFMKPLLNHGYPQVTLTKDKKIYCFRVHRLVAICFLASMDNKIYVNHKNGNKLDNRVENLEWCTPRENVQHAFRTGLQKIEKGEKHHSARFTDKQVQEMRDLWATGKYLQREIEAIFGTGRGYLTNIVRGVRR
jgi:hypothetical protein